MALRLHPRLTLDIGWSDLWFAMTFRDRARQPNVSQSAVAAAFAHGPIIAARSVRSAFLALLRSIDAPVGSEIVMSAVNIENMADIVRSAGFKPRPVDIDLDTLSPTPDAVCAAITPRTVLYLHAHLYGSRNSLAPYAAVCRARNVMIVEDCAQAYDGEAFLGSVEAGVSLFSFGPIKPATALGGAVACIRDRDVHARMLAHIAGWPVQDERALMRLARKLSMLKCLASPFLYALAIAAMRVGRLDVDAIIGAAARSFKPGDLIAQISSRPSARLLALMARRLARRPRAHWRRDVAARLRAALDPAIVTPGSRALDHAFWLFPVLAPDCADLILALRRNGFDATRGATSMRVVAGGSTPNAEKLIRDVVYLPLSPRLTSRDIARMAAVVNSAVVGRSAMAA